MKLLSTARRLEAYVQEEIGAQSRLVRLLEKQERAVRQGATSALLESAREFEVELGSGPAREGTRRRLMKELGGVFGVSPKTLTLGSIAERLGSEGRRLAELRGELRSAASAVLRASRRLAGVAKAHRGVLAEILSLLSAGGGAKGGGALVDAEA